jgi:hypothetical protein
MHPSSAQQVTLSRLCQMHSCITRRCGALTHGAHLLTGLIYSRDSVHDEPPRDHRHHITQRRRACSYIDMRVFTACMHSMMCDSTCAMIMSCTVASSVTVHVSSLDAVGSSSSATRCCGGLALYVQLGRVLGKVDTECTSHAPRTNERCADARRLCELQQPADEKRKHTKIIRNKQVTRWRNTRDMSFVSLQRG